MAWLGLRGRKKRGGAVHTAGGHTRGMEGKAQTLLPYCGAEAQTATGYRGGEGSSEVGRGGAAAVRMGYNTGGERVSYGGGAGLTGRAHRPGVG